MAAEVKTQELLKNALKIEYEPEVDVLTVYLKGVETPLSYSDEPAPGVILNYADDKSLASVEIMDARKRYPAAQLAALSVDELIDLKKAAELSGIAPVTLRAQAQKGKLWAILLAGSWVTTRERLQQYVDGHARKARSVR